MFMVVLLGLLDVGGDDCAPEGSGGRHFLLVVVFPLVILDCGDLFVWVGYPRVVLDIVLVATNSVVPVAPLGFCVISVETVKFWCGI